MCSFQSVLESLSVEERLLALSQQLHLRSLGTIPDKHRETLIAPEEITWAVVGRVLDEPQVLRLFPLALTARSAEIRMNDLMDWPLHIFKNMALAMYGLLSLAH